MDAALSWRGTPYHHAQRCKGSGIDCANFLIAVYADAGLIEEFDLPYYPPDWFLNRNAERFIDTILGYADEIRESDLEVGDAIVMRWGRCYAHGAIHIGDRMIVHSRPQTTVSRESLDVYVPRTMRFFRVRS